MTLLCARCDAEGHGTTENLPDGWMAQTITSSNKPVPLCPACTSQAPDSSRCSADNANGNADDRLRLFIERIERLEEEKRGIADDIRDTYSEAKSTGYDSAVMREIVKLRRMQPHDRNERDAILDTYRIALGLG